MTILGADPDQLKSTAQRVLTRADDYERANHQVSYWLRRMDWHGPEAERFYSLYESQMRPQLDSAAAFLRKAATELRAQAADQLRVSASQDVVGWVCGTALLPGRGLPLSNTDDAADRLRGIRTLGKWILGVDTAVGVGHYLSRHLKLLPGVRGWKPYLVKDVDTLAGAGKLLGKYGSKVLGGVSIGVSAWSLLTDVPEFVDDAEELGIAVSEGDWSGAAEAFEQSLYSGSDVVLDIGGVTFGLGMVSGNPILIGAGTGILIAGAATKIAAFGFDKLRDPIASGLKEMHGFAEDRLVETVQWMGEETREIRAEAGEALGEVGRELREATGEIANADGVIERTFEVAEGVAEVGWEVLEGGVETSAEVVKKGADWLAGGATGIARWALNR